MNEIKLGYRCLVVEVSEPLALPRVGPNPLETVRDWWLEINPDLRFLLGLVFGSATTALAILAMGGRP